MLMFMHADRSRIPSSPREKPCRTKRSPSKAANRPYAAALILARALRSSKRLCFFNRRTLKRSKSVSDWRRSCCSCFFAQLLSVHFWSTPADSHAFWTAPERAPRGSFSITIGVSSVRESWARLRVVLGPSTRAWIPAF